MISHQTSRSIPKHIQKALDEVTVKPHRNEVLFDPVILSILQDRHSEAYLRMLAGDPDMEEEKRRQIEKIRQAARQVLTGRQQECILLLLSGNDNLTAIGRELNLSRDSVRRAIRAAVPRLKEAVRQDNLEETSPAVLDRDAIKSALLPLHSEKDKKEFQEWVNRHQVLHIALASSPRREVLVLYRQAAGF